ncbi:MAG: TRAP transporter small permease subunit [Alphaproteobacteria bacterium]|jgi:C4-dicarboxylate transporter DctQ subunit
MTISGTYELFLRTLAGSAGVLLGLDLIAIIVDVLIRNFGGQPPAWTLPLVEYSLLYITALMSPWLVRTKGHIVVDVLISILPEMARNLFASAIYFICVVICITFTWYATELFIFAWVRGEMDVRSIVLPRVLLFAPMILSFTLMAIEFLRYLIGRDSLYSGSTDSKSGI